MKPDEMTKTIAAVMEGYGDVVVAAYLFGSAAKGEAGPLADVDVAVLLSKQAAGHPDDLRFRLYADLCRSLRRNDIDLLVLNNASNLIIKDEIVRNGLLVHDRDPETREEFEVRVIHYCIDFKTQRRKVMGY